MNFRNNFLIAFIVCISGCASTSVVEPLHFYEGEKLPNSELALILGSEKPGGFLKASESASFVSIDGKDLANNFSEQNPTQIYLLPGFHEIEVMYGNNLGTIYSIMSNIAPKGIIKVELKKGQIYFLKWTPVTWGKKMEFWLEDRNGIKYAQSPSK